MSARIGPYTIVRCIGGGGQGQVFLGHDTRLQRQVAIKIHRLPGARPARRNTLREARRLAGIRDPRVVHLHDVVESSDYLALVMEYIPGCNLEELLAATRLSLPSVLRIAADLSAAIAAARRQRVVHGDIKASNVLLSRDGRALLTDFGIARAARDAQTPVRPGSLEALAPEQLRGDPLDVRTDLFALGRLLFRLLTGGHPFSRGGMPSAAALLEGESVSVREHLPEGHELPDALCDLVDRLLRRDPAERPLDTHPVRRVLRELLRDLPAQEHNSLQREARPVFRPESPQEHAPAVPLQLSRSGRSRNRRLLLRRPLLALWPERPPLRALLVAVMAISAVLALARWRVPPADIVLEGPRLELGAGAHLAADVDTAFRAGLLEHGLRERRGGLVVGGLLPVRVVRLGAVGEERRAKAEVLSLTVRCSEMFCLLDLRQRIAGEIRQAQQVVASNARRDQWRRSVDATLDTLFP